MKLSRFRLVIFLLSLLVAIWVTIYGHSDNFPYVDRYDCSIYITTQGAPISFRTTGAEQGSFRKPCPDNILQRYRNQSARPFAFLADVGIWFLVIFAVFATLGWITRNRLSSKRAGLLAVLLKAVVVGLICAILARYLVPPRAGILDTLDTNVAGFLGFLGGFVVSFGILLLKRRDHTWKP